MAGVLYLAMGWLAAMVVAAVMAIAGIWLPVLLGYVWSPLVVIPFIGMAYGAWEEM